MPTPRPPYGLAPIAFPCPALATMAGRAPLGGARESALACFLVARVVGDRTSAMLDGSVSPDQWAVRAQGVKHWLGSASIPLPLRNALTRLTDASVNGDRDAMGAAFDSVMAVTANQLDQAARLELGRLAQAIAGQGTA